MCERYNALPVSGGVLDQPAGLMRKMSQVMNVYRAYAAYLRDGKQPGNMAKWRSEHSDLWEIVAEIEELREKHG